MARNLRKGSKVYFKHTAKGMSRKPVVGVVIKKQTAYLGNGRYGVGVSIRAQGQTYFKHPNQLKRLR